MPRPRARLDPAALTRAFAPDGLHGATSAAVARAAGVAKPTIYARGGSKESVFLACVEAEVERLLNHLSAADLDTRTSPPRVRLAALAEAVIEHGRAHPAAARLLYQTARHSSSGAANDVDAALARLPARLASSLRRDTTAACAERVAPALMGAAVGLIFAGSDEPERAAAMLAEAFSAVLEPLDGNEDTERVQSVGLY